MMIASRTHITLSALLSLSLLLPTACDQDDLELEAELDEDASFEFRTEWTELPSSQICTGVINDGLGLMRYCRNRSIYSDNANVERAIIVIHGSGLDAKNYYDKTIVEAGLANVDLSKTDIIAPQFFEHANAGIPIFPWSNYYTWSKYWRWGNLAHNHNRSSFDMIDHIVEELMDHRPNLQMIVVAGQSAGGQFVDRYAVGTDVDHTGVDMRFWAANPSSNVWYAPDRPDPTCSGYDNYGYGINNRNTYMSGSTSAEIKSRALTRDIFWTVGELDTLTDGVDASCKANAQGSNRNDRWDNHRTHVANLCAAEGYSWFYCLIHSARHIEIPNAPHGMTKSWESAEGHDILFGP